MKKVNRAIAVTAILVASSFSAFGQSSAGSLNNQLVKAASKGDTASVLRLLRQGAKINAVNSDGWTALESAAMEGKIEAVRLLLDKGAKIEVGGAMSYSPLTLAAEKGDVEIVKLLLDKGANIEARNMVSGTALDDAAGEGQTEVVRLLLDRGANVDARAMTGLTAVFEAALAGNGEIVKMLVAKGADVNAKFGGDDPNRTALSEAVERGNAQAVKILIENGANLEAKDDKGHTPLEKAGNYYDQKSFYTSMYKDSDYAGVVKVLLESGAALPKNKDGYGSGYLIAARDLPSPPGPNPAARQLFTMATEQIKQASTPEALAQPIALLRKAVALAPWWANAYYNLSRALEMSEQYDEAAEQLGRYLEWKPADAEARAHLAVIQAEKEGKEAAAKQVFDQEKASLDALIQSIDGRTYAPPVVKGQLGFNYIDVKGNMLIWRYRQFSDGTYWAGERENESVEITGRKITSSKGNVYAIGEDNSTITLYVKTVSTPIIFYWPPKSGSLPQ